MSGLVRRAGLSLLALGLLAGGLLSPFGETAVAAPAPSTTIVLTCDRNVSATVTFELRPSFFDSTVVGSGSIDCGPDSLSGAKRNSLKVVTTAPAGWISANATVGVEGGCLIEGALSLKQDCDPNADGIGITLVAR